MSKENGNCLKMKPTPCIFQVNLNVSEDIGLSENLIHFNSSKSKLINIPVFSRTNIWLEKRTAIGNVEIVLVAIPIKLKTFKLMMKPYQQIKREIPISKIATTKINLCWV